MLHAALAEEKEPRAVTEGSCLGRLACRDMSPCSPGPVQRGEKAVETLTQVLQFTVLICSRTCRAQGAWQSNSHMEQSGN